MAEEKPQDSTLNKIAASSVALSDCAASIRSRLLAQRETLDRLRTELAAMRSIAGISPVNGQSPAREAVEAPPPAEAPFEEQAAPSAFQVHTFPKTFTVHTFPTVEASAPENVDARPTPAPAPEPIVESLDAALDKLISQTLPAPEVAPAAAAESSVESFKSILAEFTSQPSSAPIAAAESAAPEPVLAPQIAAAPAVPEPVVESVAPEKTVDAPIQEKIASDIPAIAEPPKDEPKTASAAESSVESFESILAKFASEPPPTPAAVIEPTAAEPVLTPLFAAAPLIQEPAAAAPAAPLPHVEPVVQDLDSTLVLAPLSVAVPGAQEAPVSEVAAPEPVIEADAPDTVSEPIVREPAAPEPAGPPQPSVIVFTVPRAMVLIGLPVICLIGAFFVLARFQAPVRVARPKAAEAAEAAEAAPPPVVDDPKADEALALVQHWRMAGDEKSLFERLGSVTAYPGGAPAWSAELTDGDSYLVMFREASGTAYAFETNLKSKKVQPTPEAVERLTLIRVRDAASAKLNAR